MRTEDILRSIYTSTPKALHKFYEAVCDTYSQRLIEQFGNISGTKLPHFLTNSTIKPFIFNDKYPAHFEPIICYKGNQQILSEDEAYWVSDDIGGTFAYADSYFLGMEDIVMLVDNCIGYDEFNEWYNQWTDFDNKNRTNLRSLIMGARDVNYSKK